MKIKRLINGNNILFTTNHNSELDLYYLKHSVNGYNLYGYLLEKNIIKCKDKEFSHELILKPTNIELENLAKTVFDNIENSYIDTEIFGGINIIIYNNNNKEIKNKLLEFLNEFMYEISCVILFEENFIKIKITYFTFSDINKFVNTLK